MTLPVTTQRNNEQWITDLSASQPSESAIADLSEILRRGLFRALENRSDVTDPDVEDFAQDAVLKVIDKVDSFRGDSKFTTWAISIAIRTALTAVRKKSWGERSMEDLGLNDDHPGAPQAPEPSALDKKERAELLQALRRAIDQDLSSRQRKLVLAKLAGMPSAKIAEELNAKPNALYKLYHDARKNLRQALERDGFSADSVRILMENASHG